MATKGFLQAACRKASATIACIGPAGRCSCHSLIPSISAMAEVGSDGSSSARCTHLALKPTTVLACWLATWFVILQLIAPPGMMPRAGTDGFEITICTSQGLQQIFIETSDEDEEQKDKQNNMFCMFSFASLKSPDAASQSIFVLEPAKPKRVFAPNEVGHYTIPRRSHAPRAPPVFL
ncbi:hypothetical protein PJE062_712 [Pseudovibrio sp. JE062]|nr:hypothetical protein PJE062_712 [Pseudovibrio sp. JE062]